MPLISQLPLSGLAWQNMIHWVTEERLRLSRLAGNPCLRLSGAFLGWVLGETWGWCWEPPFSDLPAIAASRQRDGAGQTELQLLDGITLMQGGLQVGSTLPDTGAGCPEMSLPCRYLQPDHK